MPYQDKIELSDLSSYTLSDLSDFANEILNLSELYGSRVKMAVAKPPKVEWNISGFAGTASVYGARSSVMGVMDEHIQGKFQDDAILRESADTRLKRIVWLKKLGAVLNVDIDDNPLERREMIISIDREALIGLLNEIDSRLEKERGEEYQAKLKKTSIYYEAGNSTLKRGDSSVELSELEAAIAGLLFDLTLSRDEIDIVEVFEELTGEFYEKSKDDGTAMERIRQAVYRLNDKIEKTFSMKNFLKYSKRTYKITKNDYNF